MVEPPGGGASARVDGEKQRDIVIPELLEVVSPAEAVVTTDAMGAQKNIAWTIREYQAHYLLALKESHPKLVADDRWLFEHADEIGWDKLRTAKPRRWPRARTPLRAGSAAGGWSSVGLR
ncbi:MAG TPA: hypothetical protein VF171_05200 [Trueperaceae bacterium]